MRGHHGGIDVGAGFLLNSLASPLLDWMNAFVDKMYLIDRSG